jgi:threonine dehydratase
VILVSEEATRAAISRIAARDHLMIEGAAAVSIAALGDERLKGKRLCGLVTGRNITLDLFRRLTRNATRDVPEF